MEMQPDQLRISLSIFCIALIWVLQRYVTLRRELMISEQFVAMIVGSLAGGGILRIMQFSTLEEAYDALRPSMEVFAAVFVGAIVAETVYRLIAALVVWLKS